MMSVRLAYYLDPPILFLFVVLVGVLALRVRFGGGLGAVVKSRLTRSS